MPEEYGHIETYGGGYLSAPGPTDHMPPQIPRPPRKPPRRRDDRMSPWLVALVWFVAGAGIVAVLFLVKGSTPDRSSQSELTPVTVTAPPQTATVTETAPAVTKTVVETAPPETSTVTETAPVVTTEVTETKTETVTVTPTDSENPVQSPPAG